MYEVILKTGVGVRGFTDAQYDTTGLKKRLKRREEKKKNPNLPFPHNCQK